MLGTILLIVLILMLIGAIPSWPHSKKLGLRAKWRAGSGGNHPHHPAVDGKVVTGRPALRFG
jgi:hypothetical protein